jgi:hypothetical protein
MSEGLPPEFPEALWQDICAADQEDNERCAYLAKEFVYWADGRHPNDLGQLLDALRGARVYGVSLEIIEAAWNSSAPRAFRAQIAQDWVGTVLYGLNDPEGAIVVAQHVGKTAHEMGPGFLSDFSDLMMEWGLLEAAYTILSELIVKTPGDLSVRYNLGTCEKFRGDWGAALDAFEFVSRHEDAGGLVFHNLLIAAIASQDQGRIDSALTSIQGLDHRTEWNLGEVVQVEFKSEESGHPVEVLYAERVGPHQVKLRGLPRSEDLPPFDSTLLIDLQPQRYAGTEENQRLIFPVLKVVEVSSYETLTHSMGDTEQRDAVCTILEEQAIPARADGDDRILVAVTVQTRSKVQQLLTKLNVFSDAQH